MIPIPNDARRLFLRFIARVVIPEDRDACWLWIANPKGRYGQFRIGAGQLGAHVVAYELFHGPVPRHAQVLHTCDQTKCVNPRHLFVGSQADNIADKVRKGRQAKGVQMYASKLTEQDIHAIRASTDTYAVLAERYQVNISTLVRIRKHHTWKHLP